MPVNKINFWAGLKPQQLIILSFSLVIVTGAVLFMMPFATIRGGMHPVDALFMAISAVCVTGLSVLDVSKDLTFAGQIILECLIQAGGLGILTFSILFFMMVGRQLSFRGKSSAATFSMKLDTGSVRRILAFVLLMTFVIEAAGAALLFIKFKEIHSVPMAVHSAIFHSISAFCNAGFSIYSDNLVRFNGQWFIPAVIMSLIVVGGLGFTVIDDVIARMTRDPKKPKRHLSFHSKIALIGTLVLIVLGACAYLFLEHRNSLLGKPVLGQIMNSLFMSVTPRTAGFNMVDVGNMSDATLFFTILLMFIGGCPGSTAGGIKVNTFFILMALITAKIRGSEMVPLFKRKIPELVIDKALAVFAAFFLTIAGAILLLLVTETYFGGYWKLVQHEFFLQLMFEVVSAVGTVGLSTGITPHLSYAGKMIILFLMFAGRVGPLTLVIGLQTRRKTHIKFDYAEEDVMVG